MAVCYFGGMRNVTVAVLNRLLLGVVVLLILKVTANVLIGYRDYLPPNFNADFLLGRESYFYGAYSWAFYTHLLSGPPSLIVGTILISETFRRRLPRWHRRLGRLQVACVLLLVAPSGLWMARYAMSGAIAGTGLGFLAIATALCCTAGWRAAVARKFSDHQIWMWRTYLLLCSAVVIRLIGGLATVLQFDHPWVYPVSVWASWLVPLAIFEAQRVVNTSPALVARS
jgi:small-conductance mechanosensitive channel